MNDDGAVEGGEPDVPVVYDLAPGCTTEDVEPGEPYHAVVNGVVEYGVFVDLTPGVSGLVHESNLDEQYEVGESLIVELENVREDGDMAFQPVTVEGAFQTVRREHEEEVVPADELGDRVGETVRVEGEVVQINQTAGPTVFTVADESGSVPCAAFEEAGVRAFPDVEVDDVVRLDGTVEEHEGALQVETETLSVLEGEDAEAVGQRLVAAREERAEPHEVEPLVAFEALESMLPDLRDVARLLRRSVLENRPIRVRYHSDGDGMSAALPVEMAVERFAREVHEDPEAARHLFKRMPSRAPFYEMEDATRDLNYALEDRDRHGQKLPLLLMLDNGSTEEDVPAYENLRHYDVPIVVIDHHHPDPDAVGPLVEEHVNPYLHGEDYRVTTGMLCVELARMIDPSVTDEVRHVPAVAGLSDRSSAEAMDDYLALAEEAGYDRETLEDVGEALDYEAYWLKYDPGRTLLNDVLNVGCDDEERHHELVEFLAEQSEEAVDRQLDAAMAHVEREELANGADLYRVDVENFAHRFTYPAPGKTTGAIHDRKVDEEGAPVITVGYGPDFAVLRSDGVRLDIPQMVAELNEEVTGGGVSGGGHLVVGSIKFVKGMREEVLDALVEKMADAEIDEDLGAASGE